ncbi:MAG: transposase [bacterium]|nr:transposase [bacterium]
MPRTARASVGGICYHAINRGNAGAVVFRKDQDYAAFLRLIEQACERVPMRVLAFCLMPNHFHLTLWPVGDGDLSRWMQWLMTAHVRRYHAHYRSSGHVWQGRFKAFPIQKDEHLLTVMRYVEANALRANLVDRAEDWPWSSLAVQRAKQPSGFLHRGPVDRPRSWLAAVNRSLGDARLEELRTSVNRGAPLGGAAWQVRTAKRLGVESSLRPRGRPKKREKK